MSSILFPGEVAPRGKFRYHVGMRNLRRAFVFAGLFLLASTFFSCTSLLGYSVVLWAIDDEESGIHITDGTVVPVYIKSNISHVYVIGIPDSKEKIEVPLWKLTEPDKKGRVIKQAERFVPYQHQYAKCVFDGLPIRSDAVNTSKQVYRLREGEIIRALYEGKGAIPTNGVSNLEGKWLRVLTGDGTIGWCFSHNLRLFAMNADGSLGLGAEEAEVHEADKVLDAMLASKWYPDYYTQMISSGSIDLVTMRQGYGFDTGLTSGTVAVHIPSLNVEYPYSGAVKTSDNVYKFNNIPIQVTVRSGRSIIVQHTDERGMPKSYNFVTIPEDVSIEKLIAEEVTRRNDAYTSIRSLGPLFRSGNYGTLTFEADGAFNWSNFNLLVPSVISRSAKNSGHASVQYFLPQSLKKSWDGVLTFNFDGMTDEVNFLYKRESNGLRLSLASVTKELNEATNRQRISVSQPVNALIIFFQK